MTTAKFIADLEDYFAGPYKLTQRAEVKAWAEKRNDKSRYYVYKYCVLNLPVHFSPPGIKTLNENLAEILEAYPELSADSYNAQIKHDAKLLTEGEFTDGERLLHALAVAIRDGRNPADDETVKQIMESNGYGGKE